MDIKVNNTVIHLKVGDITEENTEAIVNPANSSLMGGAGVDGAIHSKGGSEILKECKEIRKTLYPDGLPTGKAVITTGGNLKARYVIHTVGPICNGSWNKKFEKNLYDAYLNCLELAKKEKLDSISFPFISAGAYRCPKMFASEVALKAIINFVKNNNIPKRINIVLFSRDDYQIFKEVLDRINL